MSSVAVQQAVALLRERLAEARADVSRLAAEITEIEGALQSLGCTPGQDRVLAAASLGSTGPLNATNPPNLDGMSVARAVKAVLDSEPGPWTPSAVRDRLAGTQIQGDRTDDKFVDVIRTAFYNLRKRGQVMTDDRNRTTSKVWLPDGPTPGNDFGPADSAGPKEASDDASLQPGTVVAGAFGSSLPVR